jgi:hypothetical protein
MVFTTDGKAFISKKGNHVVKSTTITDLTKDKESQTVELSLIELHPEMSKEDIQRVIELVDSGKLEKETVLV